MAKIELNTVVPASFDEVWTYATDYENWPEFVANLQSAELVSGGREEGGVVEMSYKLVGDRTIKMSQTIEIMDRETGVFAGRLTEGFIGTNRWTYEPIDDGDATKVSVLMDYTVPGALLGQIADKLVIERYNTKSIETSLDNLRAKLG